MDDEEQQMLPGVDINGYIPMDEMPPDEMMEEEIEEPLLEEEEMVEEDHYANLANDMSEGSLNKLSSYLLEAIEEDIQARTKWLTPIEKAKEYLGFSLEDSTETVKGIGKTFDGTLPTALIRFYSLVRSEILPPSGPTDTKIKGEGNDQLEALAEKICDFFNGFFTEVDQSYYPDFEKLILHVGLYGSAFKKVYFDASLGYPIARFINPKNFIVNADCTSILESGRITQVMKLTKQDILSKVQNGIYRDNVDFDFEGGDDDDITSLSGSSTTTSNEVDTSGYTEHNLLDIYEIHTYLALEQFDDMVRPDELKNIIPLPYVVTIDPDSKEVLAINRNWYPEDPKKTKINYFVQYNYLPGFDIWGIGLAQLGGSNAITLTQLLRQLVTAGSFKSMPSGICVPGYKQQNTTVNMIPGQFVPVDTGGTPLQEAFMPLPFSEPSQTLNALRQEMVQQLRELAATGELGLSENKQNMAVGTTLALLESANKIQSAVLRSIYYSFCLELQMIYDLFKGMNRENSEFEIPELPDDIILIPVVDPAVNSSTQKIIRAESLLQTALTGPQFHNMTAVYERVYQAFGVNDIDQILKKEEEPPQVIPMDPITENMNIMQGIPVDAVEWQDHDAHIIVHGIDEITNLPTGQDHIKKHMALKYKIQMQQGMGMELPPLDQLQDPQLQNHIAMQAAAAMQDMNGMDGVEQQAPLDPMAVQMAEIESKERIANLQAETDVFRSQLDFEKEKAKIESNQAIAEMKSETELTKQEIQNNGHII